MSATATLPAPTKATAPTPAHTAAELEGYTVADLRAACKSSGRKGYSGLTKAGLVHLLRTDERLPPSAGSVADLRQQCKDAGITGASKLNKAQLQTALATGTAPKVEPKLFALDWLKAVATKHNVAGRSKAKTKADLEVLLDKAGIDLATASA